MKEVVWAPSAQESLKETEAFISELWNNEITEKFLSQL